MLRLQSYPRCDYSERELVAAEGLIMLWRSWQTPMIVPVPAPHRSVTVTNEVKQFTVSRPPVSRHSSPTEAYAVPVSKISPWSSEPGSYLNLKQEEVPVPNTERLKHEVVDPNATENLKEAVSQAIHKWRGETIGAKCVSAQTVAKIAREAVLRTTHHETAGPSKACLTPIDNVNRISRLPSSAPCRASSSIKNKENVRIKREVPSYTESETKTCVQLIPIGDGNARVPAYILKTMDWKRYKAATRTLLEVVFGRRVLATHNLTGKPSPAFPNRIPKGKLDEALVRDIVQTVVVQSGVSASLVRSSITSKCADEGKMYNERKYNSLSYYE